MVNKKSVFVNEHTENADFIRVSLLTNTDIDNKMDNKIVNVRLYATYR